MGDSKVLSLDKLLSSSHHFIQEPVFVSYAMTKCQRRMTSGKIGSGSFFVILSSESAPIVVGPVVRQRIMECDGGEGEEGKLRGGRRRKRERRGERERSRDGDIRLGTSYAFRVHLQ